MLSVDIQNAVTAFMVSLSCRSSAQLKRSISVQAGDWVAYRMDFYDKEVHILFVFLGDYVLILYFLTICAFTAQYRGVFFALLYSAEG